MSRRAAITSPLKVGWGTLGREEGREVSLGLNIQANVANAPIKANTMMAKIIRAKKMNSILHRSAPAKSQKTFAYPHYAQLCLQVRAD